MINYVECTALSDRQIYDAFMTCFSDYMLQIKMEQDVFISRFFGCEGNSREYSYVAYENKIPVGVCLGGIKTDEQFKTLRCGGMAVVADVRGKGVAKTLLGMHRKKAEELGCKQLFLEVIDGNDRAIAFYAKNGYEKVYNLSYRKLDKKMIDGFTSNNSADGLTEEVSRDDVYSFRDRDNSHLPWQCSFDYCKDLNFKYYGIKQEGELVAGIVASDKKVSYLWVEKNHRGKGYAKALIHRVIYDLKPVTLNFNYANNHSAHTFCNHLGMEDAGIAQLEMYQEL